MSYVSLIDFEPGLTLLGFTIIIVQTRKSKVEPLSLRLLFTCPYLSHYIGLSKFSTLLWYRLLRQNLSDVWNWFHFYKINYNSKINTCTNRQVYFEGMSCFFILRNGPLTSNNLVAVLTLCSSNTSAPRQYRRQWQWIRWHQELYQL